MADKSMCWEDRKRLRPNTYVWKGRLLTCDRWVITSADRRRACELEHNSKGWTVDFFLYDCDGVPDGQNHFSGRIRFPIC